MAFRQVMIENPAKLSVKQGQLVINQDDTHTLSLEDINCLLLDNPQISITGYALSQMAQEGITVLCCDDKHLPCGALFPLYTHTRQLKMLKAQLEYSQPAVKRLWQQIVIRKIENQALCLQLCGKENHGVLAMAEKVLSGDSGHMEGAAANLYFKTLWGKNFTRDQETIINAALNYGYAILRGVLAKKLCLYGFEPLIGLFHHSEQNHFNLADDLLEPFRPVVDLYVAAHRLDFESVNTLIPLFKRDLFNLLNADMDMEGGHYTVAYALEGVVKGLSAWYTDKKPLDLPKLLPLTLHHHA